jgi:uncharacterized membrane protein YjfL (UPF0719 family)
MVPPTIRSVVSRVAAKLYSFSTVTPEECPWRNVRAKGLAAAIAANGVLMGLAALAIDSEHFNAWSFLSLS